MKHKILIVDDNKLNQIIIKEILNENFITDIANDGGSALKMIPELNPSIVLVDIMMPGIAGYEVCKTLKQASETSHINILLVSAKSTLEDRLMGYKAGADDYITKPFDENELYAKVNVFGRLVEEEIKRKLAEEKLRRNEIKFRSIFSNANDAIFLVNSKDVFIECNEKTLSVFKSSKSEIIDHSLCEFLPEKQPDGRNSIEKRRELNERTEEEQQQVFEWQYKRKDESLFFAEVSLKVLNLDGERKFLSIVRDISERKEYEKKIRAANEEMQALSETGALVATVAHDAKKFTSAMSMSLEGLVIPSLRTKLEQSDPWVMDLMNDILEVHANSLQCTSFLESLLAINRKDEQIEPISAVDILKQAFGLLSYSLMQEKVDWTLRFETGRRMMIMGNSQLIRVFMNLIANAADALMKYETETPSVTVDIVDIGSKIQISVHDNGPGIKQEILESIRKGMVISTKGKRGNGFGVSGATQIVKSCNGSMQIESELGKGATFIVTLEKAEEHEKKEVDLDGVDLF